MLAHEAESERRHIAQKRRIGSPRKRASLTDATKPNVTFTS
jgi:hypothetical protein